MPTFFVNRAGECSHDGLRIVIRAAFRARRVSLAAPTTRRAADSRRIA